MLKNNKKILANYRDAIRALYRREEKIESVDTTILKPRYANETRDLGMRIQGMEHVLCILPEESDAIKRNIRAEFTSGNS